MIRSLAVLLVPVILIVIFFTNNLDDHPVKVVDWQPVLAQARTEAPYEVLAPVNLPDDWRPIRVSWTKAGESDAAGKPSVRNAWQLGYLDPKDIYIEVRQGDIDPADLVRTESREGSSDGTSTVGGASWQRLVSPDGRTKTIVLSGAKATTVVSGDTSYAELEAFASSLAGPSTP